MTEDLEPATADEPTPGQDSWKTQYEPGSAGAQAAVVTPPPPLLASAAPEPVTTRPLWLAFLAAAVVALVSGLVWAGISVATGYSLGILAIVIGAVTGLTAQRVAGAGIGGFERGLAGIFAAGAIILGNYVIFVHEVKDALGRLHAASGVSVGYLNGDEINEFVKHFGTYVHGFDWFWIALAAWAAIRTAGGTAVMGMGRRRS